jgi:TupA-like ATPgrasp
LIHPRGNQILNPIKAFYNFLIENLAPETSLRLQYLRYHHRVPHLKNPKLFTEKVQYRKLHDRNPMLPLYADKVKVKDLVALILGKEWVIPTLWSGPVLPLREERNWPLPYVLKANHGCEMNIFVRSAADRNWPEIESKVEDWLNINYYNKVRHEWLYSQIRPQILVEPYLGSLAELPTDFKFLVFNGRVESIATHTGRQDRRHYRVAFYDRSWNKQPFTLKSALPHPGLPKPTSLERMIAAAEQVAKDTPFARIDFYD